MRKLYPLCVSCLSLLLLAPAHAGASSIVAADDGGYAGNVIEKVGNEWTPPPGLRGTFSVRIKVTVGEDGKVRSCKPTEPSAIKALDDAACGAVYKAAPFGKTPDGKPVDVHMAFRIGTPKKAPREPSFEEVAVETMKERERLNNQIANEKASYQSSRAKEQAEALAQKMGKDLPELHMTPLEVSKPVPVPSPLGRRKKDAAGSADASASGKQEQGRQSQVRQKIESSGVLIGGTKEDKGPELVIKSNLKNLDAALEAQSEATAEAQAPSPDGPISFVNRQPASPASDTAAVPPQAKAAKGGLTQDEMDIPPLEHLKAEVTLLPAPKKPETPTAPAPEQQTKAQDKETEAMKSPAKVQTPEAKGTKDAKDKKDAKDAAQTTNPKLEQAAAPAKAQPSEPVKPDAKEAAQTAETAKPKEEVKTVEPVKAASSSPAAIAAPASAEDTKPAPVAPADKTQQAQTPKTAEPAQPAAEDTKPGPATEEAKTTPPADMGYAEYLDRLKQDIQKKIRLPKLPQGRHLVSVQLYLSRKGRIQRADLIHNSSNVKRDEQLAEAVKLVDRVTPPPAALGRSFPLTLVFDVQ